MEGMEGRLEEKSNEWKEKKEICERMEKKVAKGW